MKIKPYKKILLAVLFALSFFGTVILFGGDTSTVYAANGCTSQQVNTYNGSADACAGTPPAQVDTTKPSGSTDFVGNYINPFIDFLTGAVGLVVTISLVAAGIQYASSADDPQKVASARRRIVNTVIALLTFIFLWAFLQWIIPGGVFGDAGQALRSVAVVHTGPHFLLHSLWGHFFSVISRVL